MQSDLLDAPAATAPVSLARSPRFFARLLDDHLLVLDQQRQELHVLNPTAALLWLWLDDQPCSPAALQQLLQGQGASRAAQDGVAPTVQQWLDLGWLESPQPGIYRLVQQAGPAPDAWRGRAERLPDSHELPAAGAVEDVLVQLGGRRCRVRLSEAGGTRFPHALPRLRAVLTGLQVQGEPEGPLLQIVHAPDGLWLSQPGLRARSDDESFALASVVQGLFQQAYADAGLFATLHAAAVWRPGGALLLPGVSGAGKSTLTAWLTAHGWGYLGDDVIALGRRSGEVQVLALPTAVGIKPGSWALLQPLYPELEHLPGVPYADRQARFLPLPRGDEHSERNPCVRALVMPSYMPGSATCIQPLSPVQALCRLIGSGVTTADDLSVARVNQLLDLLLTLPCYTLSYSQLSEAQQALAEVLHRHAPIA